MGKRTKRWLVTDGWTVLILVAVGIVWFALSSTYQRTPGGEVTETFVGFFHWLSFGRETVNGNVLRWHWQIAPWRLLITIALSGLAASWIAWKGQLRLSSTHG